MRSGLRSGRAARELAELAVEEGAVGGAPSEAASGGGGLGHGEDTPVEPQPCSCAAALFNRLLARLLPV